MKYLIASDIHGSSYYAQKVVERFNSEGADKLILLGDVYNHGPRNPLPKDYAPMQVAKILNAIKENLIVIRGNCDSQVDDMISEFSFVENMVLCVENKCVFLTHGHLFNRDNMPKTKFNAIIYGHFHTGFIEEQKGVVVANAGSTSLPKGDTPNSYMLLEGTKLTLKDITGKQIKSIEI